MFGRPAKSHIPEDFLSLARSVGYRDPTRLEQKAVPLILAGKDVVIETSAPDEATKAFLLPLLRRSGTPAAAFETLILTTSSEGVKRFARQLKTFPSAAVPEAVHIGVDDNIRRELSLLSKPFEVVVATPQRLIDHLRRENISLSKLTLVMMELPDDLAETGFDKDVQFIYSKLPSRVQTVVASASEVESGPLAEILHRPSFVRHSETIGPSACLYLVERDEEKSQLLSDVFYAKRLQSVLVACKNATTAREVHAHLEKEGIRSCCLVTGGLRKEKEELRTELATGFLEVVVTDLPGGGGGFPQFKSLVLFHAPESSEEYARAAAHLSGEESQGRIIILGSREESSLLKRIQEVQHVDTAANPSQDDVLRGRIASMIKRIRETENPDELNKYRRVIRKNVPFSLRGYFTAFILKESLGKPAAASAEFQGDMKTLFVSIGKNRKVFPRDLSRLFTGVLNVKSSMIGSIKVLDNYSFIDVPESMADKAIELLDGTDFRGRKLTVNHARKREEKEE